MFYILGPSLTSPAHDAYLGGTPIPNGRCVRECLFTSIEEAEKQYLGSPYTTIFEAEVVGPPNENGAYEVRYLRQVSPSPTEATKDAE